MVVATVNQTTTTHGNLRGAPLSLRRYPLVCRRPRWTSGRPVRTQLVTYAEKGLGGGSFRIAGFLCGDDCYPLFGCRYGHTLDRLLQNARQATHDVTKSAHSSITKGGRPSEGRGFPFE